MLDTSADVLVTQLGLGGTGTEIGSAVHAFFLIRSFRGLVWFGCRHTVTLCGEEYGCRLEQCSVRDILI